jgi:hypothetical protein
MLKVTMGEGVSVSVVKDDTVIPLNDGGTPVFVWGSVVVATTTECGIVRMRARRCDDSGGSLLEVVTFPPS